MSGLDHLAEHTEEEDLEAMRLGGHINLRLKALPGATEEDASALVAELAPGWDFVHSTALGDASPSIILTAFRGDEPL